MSIAHYQLQSHQLLSQLNLCTKIVNNLQNRAATKAETEGSQAERLQTKEPIVNRFQTSTFLV